MRFFRSFLDRQKDRFQSGGRLDRLYPLFEAVDTIFYTPDSVTTGTTHVRDALDLKRMMSVVVAALMPIVFFAMYNTGLQANRAIAAGATPLDDWQTRLFQALGFGFSTDFWACFIHGALYFLPIFIIGFAAGGVVEVIFACVRGHEINEGFFVTGFLLPLILPTTIPLWQVASGAVFGVLIGKEIFGGTGMNVLNPALTARAFLFFAYPAEISGDKPWIAADFIGVDGFSGATWLARATDEGPQVLGQVGGTNWIEAFLGFIPGSMGETSALLCLVGAVILIVTRIGSWRTMLGVVVGTAGMAALLNVIGSETNPAFAIPFGWHVVLGGWALGTVFMATDPVSSAFTDKGRLIYGFGIGIMVILVRVVNPAYPEGMMLAILFMNMFAPFIDHFFVQANIKRRLARNAAVQ
ncbi:MAG: NADH:ubiquinone reductase (Na(+)-transporting) subunit B [Acidobacteria bacterium]|nr:NADH:ubiquinone reductase (Na(+)-transporting) subunit B [Candidatus Sulfomarinibacter sp. MAG AM1]